jgi:hypothetical protein
MHCRNLLSSGGAAIAATLLFAAPLAEVTAATAPALAATNPYAELSTGFQNPPTEARPLTWWHWMNGCVTKEGITADLESMKRVGLGGAQLFSVHLTAIGLFSVQAAKYASQYRELMGEVEYMSPEWRALVQHALSESKRLGLELSILNSEGWGQAGGPWVTPADSMQKVVWSESQVKGGQRVALQLKRPVPEPQYFKDIALLAVPTPAGDQLSTQPRMTVSAEIAAHPSSLTHPHAEPALFTMPLPTPRRPQWIQLDFGEPRGASSVYIGINDMRDNTDPERWEDAPYLNAAGKKALSEIPGPHYWELQASEDAKNYQPIGRISSHGTSSFPETKARYFRIWMPVPPPLEKPLPIAETEPMEITSVVLSGPRIDQAETRAGKYIDWRIKEFSGAVILPESVTSRAKVLTLTGRTEWDAPPGAWTLLRFGHASTGATLANGTGLEVDKLSRGSVLKHLTEGMVEKVLADAGPLVGTTLKNILCDSWERGYGNWTPLMREEFEKRRGYSLDPWLPALAGRVMESSEASERFLWDFRRTLADLLADNYYGTLQDYARQHNLGVYAEATGHFLPGLADQLQCKGRVDVPMGEFWSGARDVDDAKEAASAAHIYGKRIAAAESFTARTDNASWTRDPFMLKAEGDLRFCMGINQLCFHRFAHQPWPDRRPGMTMGKWGTELEHTNTWWELAGPWIEYLTRCQFLLQRGTFVADVCCFYGEDVPMDFRFARLAPALPGGYDFDVCNAEVLVHRMTMKDGRITLPHGPSYRVLVLPDTNRMTLTVLRAVQRLVHTGATVVGPKPTRSPSLEGQPESDEALQAIANEVWGDCDGQTITEHRYGAGRIRWGGTLAASIGVPPDFTSSDPNLRFIHRRDGDIEIYFISNQGKEATFATCTFRGGGVVPELWYPDSGKRVSAAMYSNQNGQVSMPIPLDPSGSVFVLLRPAKSGDTVVSIEEPRAAQDAVSTRTLATVPPPVFVNGKVQMLVSIAGKYVFNMGSGKVLTASVDEIPSPVELTGPWQLSFPPNLGAPPTATFERLSSWADSRQDGIRYFSGTVTYQKTFVVTDKQKEAGLQLYLDLGTVKNLCEVSLNGHNLGVLWKPPFRVDITSAARSGPNQLEVKVTNLWPNRLIGDRKIPEASRITWTTFNPYETDSPLLESGLLGPVRLTAARVVRVGP